MPQEFKTVDVLRLEVENTPATLQSVNLIQNPYGDLGAWGWISPVPGSQVSVINTSGYTWITYAPVINVPNWFTTEAVPVSAGQYVAARWEQASPDGTHYSRARVEWLDATGTLISSSAQGGYQTVTTGPMTSGGTVCQYSAVQAPANTVRARLRFDYYSTTAGANPSSSIIMHFRRPILLRGATAAAVNSPPLTALDPATYSNVLGAALDIAVERNELTVGTLTATIADATIDPSQSNLVRPGKRVRLMVNNGTQWTAMFTGKIASGTTTHDLQRTGNNRARVALTAVDAASQLAQVPRPNGVGTIADLPYVLEGAGVPWNINGSGIHKITATVVAASDSFTVLDQVGITRDTALGYAWIDRRGVATAYDRSSIPTTNQATLNESAYTDIDVDYDADRIINTVTVKLLRTNAATGQTVEVTRGPYIDQGSIDQWGPRSKDFTVQGLADTDAAAQAFAQTVLAANATPVVRINSVTLPVTKPVHLSHSAGVKRALIDLYDAVRVVNTSAGIDQTARPTGITHKITPNKWLVSLDFARDGGVAAPQATPDLVSQPTITPAPTQQNGQATFGTFAAVNSVQSVSVTFPVAFAVAPRVFAVVRTSTANAFTAVTVSGYSATGCTLNLARTSGTAGINVDWFAVV